MSEFVRPSSQLLRDATDEYRYTTPDGVNVWCPYIRNNGPYLPSLQSGVLSREGAGKISPVEFQKAAQYAYEQVMVEGVGYQLNVPDAIRMRLVDGTLQDDNYNYTGVDCSRFVTHVWDYAFGQSGGDLFDVLKVPYNDVVNGYTMPGWTPNHDEKDTVLERARDTSGLSIKEYTRKFRGHNQPARGVNVARLFANTVNVEGDVQPGDLAFYTHTDSRIPSHVAIVLDTGDRNSVHLAHSGRRDPAVEIGGVEIFSFPRKKVFRKNFQHGPRGTMAIRRLNALASG